ncbi:MAG TPA: thioredoxin-dependent thiol peroxidase [Candidatus Saccharimonadia bacterium]
MTAPDFTLPDQTGQPRSLQDYAGQWLIIYFYPKDDTPGCTQEACDFRDSLGELRAAGLQVVGVSRDNQKSHAKFAEKYQLPFPLLTDESTAMMQAYGAWGPKTFMGRKFDGITRMTVLVNPQGEIVKTYPKVNPHGHVAQILSDFKALSS